MHRWIYPDEIEDFAHELHDGDTYAKGQVVSIEVSNKGDGTLKVVTTGSDKLEVPNITNTYTPPASCISTTSRSLVLRRAVIFVRVAFELACPRWINAGTARGGFKHE